MAPGPVSRRPGRSPPGPRRGQGSASIGSPTAASAATARRAVRQPATRPASEVPSQAAGADAGEQVAVAVQAEPGVPGDQDQQHGLHAVDQAAHDVGADQADGPGMRPQRGGAVGDAR